MIRYISLFSGIEAASCAWEPLGWEPVAFSEIEPFPCAVLAERFPNVPNLGDITEIDWKEVLEKYGEVDLIVGGSPCQSFSVAGKREGLSGESRLMFEYIRAVQEVRPRWFVWENVPGALTSEGGGGLSDSSSGKWMASGTAWRGEYSTRDSSEFPNGAEGSSLSDVLETSRVPAKYSLSLRCCAGMRRRATSAGRSFPPMLEAALDERLR